MDLSGKVVVVTGAGQGNGAALSGGFLEAGAQVVGVDIEFTDVQPTDLLKIEGDVTDPRTISQALRVALDLGQDLVLINNAGITRPHGTPYPIDLWRETIEVNLTSPHRWIESFCEPMKLRKSGSIINITSLAAERGFADNPSYAASKGGLKALTKSYAYALGPLGIRCNCIGPGYIKTNMTAKSQDSSARSQMILDNTPLGRWGHPRDLVGLACLLASDEGSFITGQDIYVDGGWLAVGMVEGGSK